METYCLLFRQYRKEVVRKGKQNLDNCEGQPLTVWQNRLVRWAEMEFVRKRWLSDYSADYILDIYPSVPKCMDLCHVGCRRINTRTRSQYTRSPYIMFKNRILKAWELLYIVDVLGVDLFLSLPLTPELSVVYSWHSFWLDKQINTVKMYG